MSIFVKRSRLPVSAERAFGWHAAPGALEALTPPWEPVEIVERTGGIADGARVVLRIGRRPFRLRWIAVHSGFIAGRQFRDVQISGPFARWEHTHRFEPDGADACWLEDRVEYKLPLGPVGELFGRTLVRRKLERLFEYRHAATLKHLGE